MMRHGKERMRVSERVTQVFLRAFRLPGRQQLPALAAVPAGELVVTAQLPFAAAPLPAAAPLLQIGRQLCTQTPPLRPPKCDQTPRREPHLMLPEVWR